MLRKHNSLEKFFPDNRRSLEIISKANSISGGFTSWDTTKSCNRVSVAGGHNVWFGGWNIACGICCPGRTKSQKRKWDPFSQSVLMYRCLQTLMCISAREEKNSSFASIFRTTLDAWAQPNVYERKQSYGYSELHSTLECMGKDPWSSGAVFWHKNW